VSDLSGHASSVAVLNSGIMQGPAEIPDNLATQL